MKEKKRTFTNKLLTGLLTLLGFSSTFAFMACYGPPPQDLKYLDEVEASDTVPLTRSDDDSTDAALINSESIPVDSPVGIE